MCTTNKILLQVKTLKKSYSNFIQIDLFTNIFYIFQSESNIIIIKIIKSLMGDQSEHRVQAANMKLMGEMSNISNQKKTIYHFPRESATVSRIDKNSPGFQIPST